MAGSGALGFADGPAATASFVAPSGLRFGPDGTLYVADRGSQRIRAVSPAGVVTTIAGSGELVPLGIGVPGGFANGPAARARFDSPEDVAVLPDGTLLVADQMNSCIRAIAHGTVSTYAGDCGHPGAAGGGLSDARFGEPRSLTVSGNGDVFVVDPPHGIRRISNGVVSDFTSNHSVDAIAVSTPIADPSALLIATATLIDVTDAASGRVRSELTLDTSYVAGSTREAVTPAGPAIGIAGFDADDFLYADPLNSAVMLGQIGTSTGNHANYLRVLGAAPSFETPIAGATFRDGADATARFDEPVAIAVATDGRAAVADLGNRRIRLIAPFDHDSRVLRVDDNLELPELPDPTVYRIALVGNSNFSTSQGWDDSIAGEFERLVNANLPHGAKRIEVYPVIRQGTLVTNLLSLIEANFADGGFDAVVVDFSDRGQYLDPIEKVDTFFPPGWPLKVRADFRNVKSRLAASHTDLIAVLHPGPDDFEDETAYRFTYKGMANPLTQQQWDPAAVQGFRDDVLSALQDSGVPSIDCWPDFVTAHASRARAPLFGSWDNHLSPPGREIVARALAAYFAGR